MSLIKKMLSIVVILAAVTPQAMTQEPSASDLRAHDVLMQRYVAAERALRTGLRKVSNSGETNEVQHAEIEGLARVRDLAAQRANESGAILGLPVPSIDSMLPQIESPTRPNEMFQRARELEAQARAADVRTLIRRIGLPVKV